MRFLSQAAIQLMRGVRSSRILRALGISLAVLLLGIVLLIPEGTVFAGVLEIGQEFVAKAAANGMYIILSVLGRLTVVLFGILTQVAQYNDFLNASAVRIGWPIVRDLANMFFIMVLLVIAFGTVFRIQTYRYNVLLRRVIIMAVLINFSKTITGFFIDLTQVVMLTFVNAFADTAAGNLSTALGLEEVLKYDPGLSGAEISQLSIAGTIFLGLILISIMFIVILVFVLMFLVRIIALWILTILSPLPYLFSTFPGTRNFASQWWRYFWQYATTGPILAFFLWLTLTITRAGNTQSLITSGIPTPDISGAPTLGSDGGAVAAALSKISSQSGILSFLVSIILLVVSLIMASNLGVYGGNLAGQAAAGIQRTGARAWRGSLRAAGGAVRGAYENTLARPTEGFAKGVAGTVGRWRVPVLSNVGARAQAGIEKMQKAREEKSAAWVDNVTDLRVLRRLTNQRAQLTPGQIATRKRARNRAPSVIQNDDDFRNQLQQMELEDFRKLPASQIYDIATRLGGMGQTLHGVAIDKAEWLIRQAPQQKKRAAGYANAAGDRWTWNRTTQTAIPNPAVTGPDVTAVSSRNPTLPTGAPNPRFNPNMYLSDINEAMLAETRDVIERRYGGSAEAFYQSAEFKLSPQRFLPKDALLQVLEQQGLRRRREERGEFRLQELTGVRSASRRGSAGEAATLAMDFASRALAPLALGQSAGARLTGGQKDLAVDILSQTLRKQREEKRADEVYERLRREDETAGVMHTDERARGRRQEALGQVRADALFQQQLDQETDTFRRSLGNASAINLVNKGRIGRSARQVVRHEQSHEATESLSPQQLTEMWNDLSPERQREVEQYIRQNWADGARMSLDEVQREFFTEIMASHGRGEQLGPLRLLDDEDDIAEQLANAVYTNKSERARFEVDTLPKEGIDALWEQLSDARQQVIEEFIREQWAQGVAMNSDEVKREFFTEALAAHRGGDKVGPMVFQEEERDMGLLLHAAAGGSRFQPIKASRGVRGPRIPPVAPTVPVSVGELGQARSVPIAPQPAGIRRVNGAQPAPQVPPRAEAPISPVVQRNVVESPTVRSVANDFSQKISGPLSSLPTRPELLYLLAQLQNSMLEVARRQGIADTELQQLNGEMDRLKVDLRAPIRRAEDNRELQQRLQRLVGRFGVGETQEEGGETPAAAA